MDFIDRSPILASLNYTKGQVMARLGRRHRSGKTGDNLGLGKAVTYIHDVVEDYVRYGGGGDPACIAGKAILEVGPGDNLGVALKFLAMGAESVTCMDAFQPSPSESSAEIYRALYDSMNETERHRIADVIEKGAKGGIRLKHGRRLATHYLASIENAHEALVPGRYDIIVSRAVLEHIGDINAGWENMCRSLKPDGQMWHKVDFRSHQFYERIHPLYFLTIPEGMWRLVSRPDPTLNRARLPLYREFLKRDFVESTIYYTRVIGAHEILPHVETMIADVHYQQTHLDLVRTVRSSLQQPFASYSDQDLLVNGIFLCARNRRS